MNYVLTRFLPSFIRVRLEGRTTLQKILANTGWLFVDKIIRMGVGLLVGVWVARYLGPEQFGIYSYALSFTALFSTFATLGLDGIVVRNIVRDPSFKDEILGTAFVLKLLGGALTLVFAVLTVSLLRPHENLIRWLVGIIAAGTIFQAFDVIDFWFQSQVQSKYTVYAKNIAFLLIAIVKIVLIFMKAPLVAFAWAGLAEIVVGSVGLIIAYRANGFYVKEWIATVSRSKMLIHDSWPLILSGIAIYIQARIDQVMLGEMIGDAEVGQYSAAMRLIEVFGFIPMIIYSSVLPKVSSAKIENESLYYERLLNIYRLMFLLFLVTAIPIYVFSNQIVITLFGNEYKMAGALLALFSIRLFFANFGVAKSLFITNENLFKYALFTAISGAITNIGLNYLLIPRYASRGAILATIASFFITVFFVDFFHEEVRKNLRIMLKAIVTPWEMRFR